MVRYRSSFRPRFSWPRAVVFSMAVAYLAYVMMPLYWHRPGADACAFGPVSNAQYRELRSKAERELLWAQFWLPSDHSERAKRIAEAIEVVSAGSGSFFVRLAAMHAVMRSLNGQHWQSHFKGNWQSWELEPLRSRDGNVIVPRKGRSRMNMAQIGGDPSLDQSQYSENSGFRPMSFRYSYSTWADRASPISFVKYLIPTRFIDFDTLFLKDGNTYKISGFENNEYFDGFYRVSSALFYANIQDGLARRNRWSKSKDSGSCPPVPSERWTNEFIKLNTIVNVEAHNDH